MIDIFIPSYHRPKNIKTAKYFIDKIGYDPKKIHIVIDDATDDIEEYKEEAERYKCNLHIFNMDESIERYDYVHRVSKLRRSAGQSRNMFYDIAKKLDIDFYIVIDDDTNLFEIKPFGIYMRGAILEDINLVFESIKEFMQRQKIGVFALSQTGDVFGVPDRKMYRKKVMNTTFYNTKYIYRGERSALDSDTSLFVGVMNEGYFTGSTATGLVLSQTTSAKQKGGLTPTYNENRLLSKALVIPLQYPSLCHAERQKKNGNRLHHRIKYKHLNPCLIKGKRSNIAWDTYPEDVPFTNEPKRKKNGQK